jgi:hypothetical protein
MSRCRFVHPEVTRLPLSDGDFLDVKKRLTAGEERLVFTRQIRAQGLGDKAQLDFDQVGKSKLVAYIVGWSLTDENGAPVPFSESALDNLDPDSFAEIRNAVDAHETAVTAERAARKNSPDGAKASSPISPSPNSTGGDTTTSIT